MDSKDISHKLGEFDKRWDLIEDKDYKTEFDLFKTRFNNIINEEYDSFDYELVIRYCQIWGIKLEGLINEYSYPMDAIPKSFQTENNGKIFYKKIKSLFCSIENDKDFHSPDTFALYNNLYNKLKEILTYSKINLEVSRIKDEVILFPKGENELDEKLINQVLSFLNPECNTLFVEGLNSYLEGTGRSFIDSADKMRRTIEEFVKLKLENKKGLKENINEICKLHKSKCKDTFIREIINTSFKKLDDYFNANTKHGDGDIDEAECEFIIYQTGVLLRYINRLNNDTN